MEPHVEGVKRPRELVIQIWYPTEKGIAGLRPPYRDRRTTSFWTSQLALVTPNAIADAPIAHARKEGSGHPILLFSPSWSGQRMQNTFQVEELASHGYIVVAMDHPYGTDATVFPDGRIVRSAIGGGEDYSSQAAFEDFIRKATDETKIRARDARFVLDVLEKWNTADPQGLLTGKIQMTSVGIFGHSLGGTVAVQACWLDPRFKAALDMDGMVAAESAADGAKKPVLFMMEEPDVAPDASLGGMSEQKRRTVEFDRAQENLMKGSLKRYGGFWMTVAGTTHKSFSDSPLFSPLKSLTGAGSTDPKQVFEIANAYTLAFFDRYLKQEDSALLKSGSKEFREVQLEPWEAERVH
jgi:dienelactone hydrolase